MTIPEPKFPIEVAFRAAADGINYSLLEYRTCMHLAEIRQGRLQRFLKLRRNNLRLAFGEMADALAIIDEGLTELSG